MHFREMHPAKSTAAPITKPSKHAAPHPNPLCSTTHFPLPRNRFLVPLLFQTVSNRCRSARSIEIVSNGFNQLQNTKKLADLASRTPSAISFIN